MTYDSYENLQVTSDGPSLIVALNRPQKRNALSLDLLDEFEDVLETAERDDDVRGVILTGSDTFFSAGADLNEVLEAADVLDSLRYIRKIHGVTRTIEMLALPVVAAVRGFCFTGGLELILACDMRFAGKSAKFAITSARIGSVAGLGGTQRLPRIVGESRAKDILCSGREVLADEALAIGLVEHLSDDEDVLGKAKAWVDEVATRAPLSVGLSKLSVNYGADLEIGAALGLEAMISTLAAGTADRKEGISAFLEKRTATFRGI